MIAFSTIPTPKPYARIQTMIPVSALPPVTDIATIIPQITGLPVGRRALLMQHPMGVWTGGMTPAQQLAVIPEGFDVTAARAFRGRATIPPGLSRKITMPQTKIPRTTAKNPPVYLSNP